MDNVHYVAHGLLLTKCAVVYQMSSKSDDFASRYGNFMIYNMAAVCHHEFLKFRYYVT